MAVIHTDYKPLVNFLKSNIHEGIYRHWADKLRRLNIEIKYIPGKRNKVADGLSGTLFLEEGCFRIRLFKKQATDWLWMDHSGYGKMERLGFLHWYLT